jgi:hypothetical protein
LTLAEDRAAGLGCGTLARTSHPAAEGVPHGDDPEDRLCRAKAVPVTSTARRSRPGRWPAGLAWALWALTLLGLAATVWLDRLLRQAGLPELTFLLGRGNFTAAVAAVSAATVGAVVASRRPAHRVGWLLVALGLSIAASGFAFSYTRYRPVARPGALPAASYLAGFANGTVFINLSRAGSCCCWPHRVAAVGPLALVG